MIVVNMEKAREIKKEALRQERKPLLEMADVELMKAIEAGNPTSEIASYKQKLRDVTNCERIEKASTPEELKAIKIEDIISVEELTS